MGREAAADAPALRPARDHVAPTHNCTTYGVMRLAKMQQCASTEGQDGIGTIVLSAPGIQENA